MACSLISCFVAFSGWAVDYPAPKEGDPQELGIVEREMQPVKRGQYVLIPASDETRGHGTTSAAKWWKQYLVELLQRAAQGTK